VITDSVHLSFGSAGLYGGYMMLYGGSMGFKFSHVYNLIIVMVTEKNIDFEESLGAVDHLEGRIMR
jgi:hypothetical protein